MHESHQVQRLIGDAQQMMSARGIKNPKQVTVLMGELLGFDQVSVGLHWEAMTIGTPLEGTLIVVETVPAQLKCPKCSKLFFKKGSDLSCPACRVMGTPTPSGKEFCVKDITA
jgi:hydrogenase nickel incorporation protein HypA/HybF